jgi:hypothetical protein
MEIIARAGASTFSYFHSTGETFRDDVINIYRCNASDCSVSFCERNAARTETRAFEMLLAIKPRCM